MIGIKCNNCDGTVKEFVTANSIATCISASLVHDIHAYSDGITFSNAIMVDKTINKGKQRVILISSYSGPAFVTL